MIKKSDSGCRLFSHVRDNSTRDYTRQGSSELSNSGKASTRKYSFDAAFGLLLQNQRLGTLLAAGNVINIASCM